METIHSLVIVGLMTLFSAIGVLSAEENKQTFEFNSSRNIEYENYCDSIWDNDPNYWLDVLTETDEFQNYVDLNGEWW